jgi:negative regulator of flagellin synthesis FlgM
MKINESHRITALQSLYGKNNAAGTSNAGSLKRKDEVSISTEAIELHQSQQVTNAERSQKIEELKNSVATGTYYVEDGKLAEKLLPFIR